MSRAALAALAAAVVGCAHQPSYMRPVATGAPAACVVRAAAPKEMVVAGAAPVSPKNDPDVPRCWWQMTTGTHIREQVCKTPRNFRSEKDTIERQMLIPRAQKTST